jgi:hypothetical protein
VIANAMRSRAFGRMIGMVRRWSVFCNAGSDGEQKIFLKIK